MRISQKRLIRLIVPFLSLVICLTTSAATQFGPIVMETQKLVYHARTKPDTPFFTYIGLPWVPTKENGIDCYRFEFTDESGRKTCSYLLMSDWRPIRFESYNISGEIVKRIDYSDNIASFDFPSENSRKTVKLSGECYDSNTTGMLFRSYPFGQKRKIDFNVVTDGQNGPIDCFKMYVQEIKREKIEVPAGVFDCYQLEMGVGGFAGVFAGKYKYYYWHSVEEPHILVKYQEPNGRMDELIGFQ